MGGFSASIFQLPLNGIAAGQISDDFSTEICVFSGEIIIVVGEVTWERKQEVLIISLKIYTRLMSRASPPFIGIQFSRPY